MFLKNKSEGDKRISYSLFKEALPHFKVQLGLGQPEVQEIDQLTEQAIRDIDDVKRQENVLAEMIEKRNTNRKLYLKKVDMFVKICKNSAGYTKSMSERAGLESETTNKTTIISNVERATSKLKVKVTPTVNKVSFDFAKQRGYEIIIYCRRANETEFKIIKQVAGKEYEDVRTNLNNADTERREYNFSLTKNDQEGARTSTYIVAVAQ